MHSFNCWVFKHRSNRRAYGERIVIRSQGILQNKSKKLLSHSGYILGGSSLASVLQLPPVTSTHIKHVWIFFRLEIYQEKSLSQLSTCWMKFPSGGNGDNFFLFMTNNQFNATKYYH